MIKLGVNIDHIATLREARKEGFPSVTDAAAVCEKAGADGITVHLREDRRHIQDTDVFGLKETLRTKLNLEMSANDEIVKIALEVKPHFVCLVPEKREELTTEGGLDVARQKDRLAGITARLKKAGIKVSMFIEADIDQVNACSQIFADAVEIHTGKYARFFKERGKISPEFKDEIKKIADASSFAVSKGLTVNAGHGLDYANIEKICSIKEMNEFNIGFSIISKSVFTGLEKAVSDMKSLMRKYTFE
ncbi:MAG: pyridoxine 5'-phosphate synthase [Endomicrobium sp.]|jgi:pyridoxine 5-phosphate synthase|nr:pyridoxine 5'-phosphate synthase [Endomicrobium sp.]